MQLRQGFNAHADTCNNVTSSPYLSHHLRSSLGKCFVFELKFV